MTTPPEEGRQPRADPADAVDPTPGGESATAPRTRRRHRRVTRPATNTDAASAAGESSDDTAAAWGEADEGSARDRWLREQRPPHWG